MKDNENLEINQNNQEDDDKRKKKLILIFFIVFVLIFSAVVVGIQHFGKVSDTAPEDETTSHISTTTSVEKIKNPIDFDTLKSGNSDIFAYIKIDDTNVDYPVVQHETNDSFYLRHKAEDKSWSASGAIYTELANSKNFYDPITVIYGHNGYGTSMFTTLHYFEDKDFFNNHPYFYIYTPSKRLTYQVVSAFKYDDRHILNSFDLVNGNELSKLQDIIQNPDSTLKNVRTELDTTINYESKIVILSTCITNQKSSRFLVCGVLVKNEETD